MSTKGDIRQSAHHGRDPIVVVAADDNFAIPLAVTIRSSIENLAADRRLSVFVLDAGIREETKARLVESWPRGRYHIQWQRVDVSALANLPVSGHINLVSYYRILIPRVLPSDVERVIYLDADLLVRADLARLWDCPLEGKLCLAAQDCAAPYLDAAQALANFERCRAHLGSPTPIPNFRELGLAGDLPYFNAGVLLIDLAAWRNADMSTRFLRCLEEHRQHVTWWDQYALNVVLAGRWGRLDPRWNQGSHVFLGQSWEESPLDRWTYQAMREDPYIVHFTTRSKPWRPLCRHPFRHEFYEYLDRTAWADWRPPRLLEIWAHLQETERRVRRGRKWLKAQVRGWFNSGGDRSDSNSAAA